MVHGTDGKNATFDAKVLPAISKDYVPLVIPLIRAARDSICVLMYYWGWNEGHDAQPMQKLNNEIKQAIRRGVKTRVLLNADHPTGNITRINVKTKGALQPFGACVKMDTIAQLTHSKMLLIDGEITVIGSHNYSERSMNSNNETSVIIFDRLVAQQYKVNFDRLFNRV